MDKINKDNYEAFYLDYLEGNLNELESVSLFNYLDANPELKAELEDDVLEYTLVPDTAHLNSFEKDDLKNFDCLLGEICLNNVNDFIIADLENTISEDKKKELDEFIAKHQLEKEKAYFFATKLKPNNSEVYKHKNELKKKGKIIPLFIKIASVAAVGLMFFNLIGFNNSEEYTLRQSNFALTIDSLNYKFDVNIASHSDSEKITQPTIKKTKFKKDEQGPLNTVEKTKIDSIPPTIEGLDFQNNDIVKEHIKPLIPTDTIGKSINIPMDNDDIAESNTTLDQSNSEIKLVDMYKPITKLTNTYTSLNASYKKSTEESEYQVTNIKIGKFSFERKKKKRK